MAVLPCLRCRRNHVVEELSGRQVHAFGRLIQHEQIGIAQQGLGQRQSLRHALAEGGDGLGGAVGQSEFVQQARDPLGQLARRDQRQGAVVLQQCPGRQVLGKRLALVDVADAGQRAAVFGREAQAEDRSRAGAADAQQGLQQRGLAGPIRSEDGEDRAARHRQGHVAQGVDASPPQQAGVIDLAHFTELDGESRHF